MKGLRNLSSSCLMLVRSFNPFLTVSGKDKANSVVDYIRNSGQHIQYCVGTNVINMVLQNSQQFALFPICSCSHSPCRCALASWNQQPFVAFGNFAFAVQINKLTPNAKGICPAELFTSNILVPRHPLKDFHSTWGCPVYRSRSVLSSRT